MQMPVSFKCSACSLQGRVSARGKGIRQPFTKLPMTVMPPRRPCVGLRCAVDAEAAPPAPQEVHSGKLWYLISPAVMKVTVLLFIYFTNAVYDFGRSQFGGDHPAVPTITGPFLSAPLPNPTCRHGHRHRHRHRHMHRHTKSLLFDAAVGH